MENNNDTQEEILSKIRSGGVSMRPGWYFSLIALLFGIGFVISLMAALYFMSFIIFMALQSGAWFAPRFGFHGWVILFKSLPWLLVGLSLLFMVILEMLVRRHAFAYRKPLLYSMTAVAAITVIGGGIIAPLHHMFFRDLEGHAPPSVAGRFYGKFGPESMRGGMREIYRGTVIESASTQFVIEDFRGETSTILVTPHTRVGSAASILEGNTVVVFGASRPFGVIEAYHIKLLR